MKNSIIILLVLAVFVGCQKGEPVPNIDDSLYFKGTINGENINLTGAFGSTGEALSDNLSPTVFKSFGPIYSFDTTPANKQLRILYGGTFLKNKFTGYQNDQDVRIVDKPFIDPDTFYSQFSVGQKNFLGHSTEYLASTEDRGVYVELQICEISKPCVHLYSYKKSTFKNDFTVDEFQILNSGTKSDFFATELKTRRAVLVKGSLSCWLYDETGLDSVKIENASFKYVVLE